MKDTFLLKTSALFSIAAILANFAAMSMSHWNIFATNWIRQLRSKNRSQSETHLS